MGNWYIQYWFDSSVTFLHPPIGPCTTSYTTSTLFIAWTFAVMTIRLNVSSLSYIFWDHEQAQHRAFHAWICYCCMCFAFGALGLVMWIRWSDLEAFAGDNDWNFSVDVIANASCIFLVGKVICRDSLKFIGTDTDTDMSWHVFF